MGPFWKPSSTRGSDRSIPTDGLDGDFKNFWFEVFLSKLLLSVAIYVASFRLYSLFEIGLFEFESEPLIDTIDYFLLMTSLSKADFYSLAILDFLPLETVTIFYFFASSNAFIPFFFRIFFKLF
jgi:hypothetical protein